MEQKSLKDHFLREIYEEFIEAAVLSGLIKIPDFFTNKAAYLKHEWVAPGMKWIDPKKEAEANRIQLATGQTTLAEIAASTGQDWYEIIDQRAKEIEYMRLKGVVLNEKGEVESIEKESDEKSDDES